MADIPVINLNPYLLAVQATLILLQQLGLIPDLNPLDYIISAFDGKPKLEDTELAALRLQHSPWWPLQALGNNLQIWVRNGVPLSTGIAADRLELSPWIYRPKGSPQFTARTQTRLRPSPSETAQPFLDRK